MEPHLTRSRASNTSESSVMGLAPTLTRVDKYTTPLVTTMSFTGTARHGECCCTLKTSSVISRARALGHFPPDQLNPEQHQLPPLFLEAGACCTSHHIMEQPWEGRRLPAGRHPEPLLSLFLRDGQFLGSICFQALKRNPSFALYRRSLPSFQLSLKPLLLWQAGSTSGEVTARSDPEQRWKRKSHGTASAC